MKFSLFKVKIARLAIFTIVGFLIVRCQEEEFAPIVKILEPDAEAVISETFVVTVEATADEDIRDVELYLDNILIGASDTAPYQFTVNITGYGSGTYTLKAQACSNSGKCGKDERNIIIAKATLDRPLEFMATKGRYGNKIALSWNKSPGTINYEVYKLNGTTMQYNKIASLEGNYFEDLDVPQKLTQYFYKVRAYNSATTYSEFSEHDYGYSSGDAYDLIRSFGREGTAIDEFGMIVHLAYHNNEIYVADDYRQRIVRYDMMGNVIGLFDPFGNVNYPIAPYFFEDKLVSTNSNVITVQNGINPPVTFNTGLIGLRQVTMDNEGYVYVTASNSNKIAKYDINGNLILQWGVEGDQMGQVNAPWGIAYYHDNIVVSNYYSGKIQFFSKSGEFIKEWLFDDTSSALDLCVKDDFLFIACGGYVAKTNYDGLVVEKIYGEFDLASGIAVADNGDLIVTDPYQRKIYIYRKSS